MDIRYRSTRDRENIVSASQAILQGLAKDGGLYVPTQIPAFDHTLTEYAGMDYRELAFQVMKLYLTDYTEKELRGCIEKAYDSKFDDPVIAPLHAADGAYFLELFHGKTIAFKDMALSILPHLMITAAKKQQEHNDIVILTATSGDTGKAALAGFAGVEGTRIIVFYPKDGVSPVQERQMVTQEGENTLVIGIHGNFDEAQTAVKRMFNDAPLVEELASRGYRFSSANSINVGRLVPQIVYYVYAYAQLLSRGVITEGEPINITVPTGNFGNILAAYYAKQMGLPVKKLLCASNENKVLYDFFGSGIYDKNRPFHLTSSPSMDILVSSNLERLIYRIAQEDTDTNVSMMKALSENGKYEITERMRECLSDFYGDFADETETAEEIRRIYESDRYVIDPHTAVAACVYDKYRRKTKDDAVTVIASTASPYKFTRSVMRALGKDQPEKDDLSLADALEKLSGVKIPAAVEELRTARVRHNIQCDVEQMPELVKDFLS